MRGTKRGRDISRAVDFFVGKNGIGSQNLLTDRREAILQQQQQQQKQQQRCHSGQIETKSEQKKREVASFSSKCQKIPKESGREKTQDRSDLHVFARCQPIWPKIQFAVTTICQSNDLLIRRFAKKTICRIDDWPMNQFIVRITC